MKALIAIVGVIAIVGAGGCASRATGTGQGHDSAAGSAGGKVIAPQGFGILKMRDENGLEWVSLPNERGAKLLAVDVTRDPFRLRVPAGTERGTVISGVFTVCADEDGRVAKVKAMRSRGTGNQAIDDDWIATMKRWRYHPYSVNGVAERFCTGTQPRVVAP